MHPLISKLQRARVEEHPYPHVVIEKALPDDLAADLLNEMPSLENLANGQPQKSNHRFSKTAGETLSDESISPVWRNFVSESMQSALLRAILGCFADSIRKEHPGLEQKYTGPLDEVEIAFRQDQNRSGNAVGMDVQIAVNTPNLVENTSVRRGHLDKANKIFTGLLYLRHPDDDSTGAELEIQELIDPNIEFGEALSVPDEKLRTVHTVPYQHNTLVIFLNTPRSVHAVTPRSMTNFPRYHINIVGELSCPFFEVPLKKKTGGLISPKQFSPITAPLTTDNIEQSPFPHIVLEDAVPNVLYRELIATMPDILNDGRPVFSFGTTSDINLYSSSTSDTSSRLAKGEFHDNEKVVRSLTDLLDDPDLAICWRDFISANLSPKAFAKYADIFAEEIRREYPDFEKRFGEIDSMSSSPRDIASAKSTDAALGCVFGTQAPIKNRPCVQRQPHLKKNTKIIEGFLVLRPEEDDSAGGEIDFFSIRPEFEPWFSKGLQIDPSFLTLEKRIPARGNTLILWLNTPRSIQQIGIRSKTEFQWPYVEFLVQMPENVFEVETVQPENVSRLETSSLSAPVAGHDITLTRPFAGSGWYPCEPWGSWTGAEANIHLEFERQKVFPELKKDYLLARIEVLHAASQEAIESASFLIDGESLASKPKMKDGHIVIECRIPVTRLDRSPGSFSLEIKVPGAKRVGSKDARNLGLGISRISIQSPDQKNNRINTVH